MQIYRRGNSGNWQVSFTAPNGKRVRVSSGTADKRQAQEYADNLKAETWRIHKLGERPRRSWKEAVVRFIDETSHKRTHGDDKAKLRWLDRYFGQLLLDEISADVISQVRGDLLSGNGPKAGKSHGNTNKYLALVRSLLRKAEREWEWLERAPMVKLTTTPHRSESFRWLTQSDAQSVLGSLEAEGLLHTAEMMRFTLATGLRESNVTGLTWNRVDLSRRAAWVDANASKSGRALSVPLNDDALVVLRKRRFEHPTHVFSFNGRPIQRANTRAWKQVLKNLGMRPQPGWHPENFRWHDLRHTWASWHVMAGTPLEVLQRLGGWASLDMVLRYAHLAPGHIAPYANNISSRKSAQNWHKTEQEASAV
ncbi:MAG: site-specific integrase [Pseudomonadota bacterium]